MLFAACSSSFTSSLVRVTIFLSGESDLEDIRLAEKTLKEIRKNKRLQNTILSQIEERKVYDNIATWNIEKQKIKVDYLDGNGQKVQLIKDGEPQFNADGEPIYEQVTVGELSPDDDRYKNAYNQHIFGNAKLGVFEPQFWSDFGQ